MQNTSNKNTNKKLNSPNLCLKYDDGIENPKEEVI